MKLFKTHYRLLLLLSLFLSCNDAVNCDSCYIEANGIRTLTMNSESVSFDFWLGSSKSAKNEGSYTLNIWEGDISDVLSPIEKLIHQNVNYTTEDIYGIILYTDVASINTSSLSNENILGFQVYYSQDNYLKTDVFALKKGNFVSVKEVSETIVDYFSTNDVYRCSKIFDSPKKGIFIFFNTKAVINVKRDKETFTKSVNDYLKNKITQKTDDSPALTEPDEGCGYPCQRKDGMSCDRIYDDPRPSYFKCVQSPCPWDRISYRESDNSFIRDFRDQYLNNYDIGRKYIKYYYSLSEYSNDFTSQNWSDLSNEKEFILEKVQMFIEDDNSKVLINNQEKNNIENIINELRYVSDDEDFNDMLDDVLYDLNHFKNKTVAQIKYEL